MASRDGVRRRIFFVGESHWDPKALDEKQVVYPSLMALVKKGKNVDSRRAKMYKNVDQYGGNDQFFNVT